MLLPLPSVPTPFNEPDVHGVCRSVVPTGKAYNHSGAKLLS